MHRRPRHSTRPRSTQLGAGFLAVSLLWVALFAAAHSHAGVAAASGVVWTGSTTPASPDPPCPACRASHQPASAQAPQPDRAVHESSASPTCLAIESPRRDTVISPRASRAPPCQTARPVTV